MCEKSLRTRVRAPRPSQGHGRKETTTPTHHEKPGRRGAPPVHRNPFANRMQARARSVPRRRISDAIRAPSLGIFGLEEPAAMGGERAREGPHHHGDALTHAEGQLGVVRLRGLVVPHAKAASFPPRLPPHSLAMEGLLCGVAKASFGLPPLLQPTPTARGSIPRAAMHFFFHLQPVCTNHPFLTPPAHTHAHRTARTVHRRLPSSLVGAVSLERRQRGRGNREAGGDINRATYLLRHALG